MRRRAALGGAAIAGVVALVSSSAPAAEQPFSFALLGDVPYGAADAAAMPDLVADLNNDTDVDFVAHAGDIKSGAQQCSDANLSARFESFQAFEDPFWYTPGDNEWTDCRNNADPTALPTERLDFLRTLFFPNPDQTTGSTTRPVISQASDPDHATYVENTLFTESCVTFGAIHVVGSQNGTNPWSNETPAETVIRTTEVDERSAANVAWVDEIFDAATGSDAVFVLMHARVQRLTPSYAELRDRLVARASAFDGPVIVANGDEHSFVTEPEFLGVSNMTRWQTPGGTGAVSDWIKVDVDCSSSSVFSQSSVAVGSTPTTTTTTTLPPSTTMPGAAVERIDVPSTATAKAVRLD